MKILLLTNEYPPYVYGGAGIHVEHLSQELSKLCSVEVRSFGDQEISKETLSVKGFKSSPFRYDCPEPLRRVFDATQRCLDFNSTGITADIVHVHTWYTHLGGILAKMNYGIPLVVTVHSLEPLRPWKKEQLGGGYDFSCWVEKTAIEMADAVIVVSEETRQDILKFFDIPPQKIHVIHNGVDPDVYKPVKAPHLLSAVGVDPKRPFVLFMGRITRQKGIIHLVRAIRHMKGDHQIVLCASSPDTPEIAQEMTALVEEVQKTHPHVLWLRDMMDTPTKIALYSHAAVFCCPSIYEPFGIINIEAMACETPVVASAVGGIKEAVVSGQTGLLVPVDMKECTRFEPQDPDSFEKALARDIDLLMFDEGLRKKMGAAGRQRVLESFTWSHIAQKTLQLYSNLIA